MAVFGVTMVKNENDVIMGTMLHMAAEVDHIIVADNGSDDGTRCTLATLAEELPLTIVYDDEPAYYQSVKMTALAARAAQEGATWIVPFDADELWNAGGGQHRIRDVLPGLPDDITVASAPLLNHLRTAVDEDDPDPFRSMVWRARDPAPLPKVAFRWEDKAVIHQGNHAVSLPSGGLVIPALEVRHFPARSQDQWIRKGLQGAAAYALTDLPQEQGAHWRSYQRIHDLYGREALEAAFAEHWFYRSPADAGLVLDPAPYRREG